MTRAALRDAVIEGALLRLRPKVMTVSTVVAGLLPIMWSTRVGAEVMKPLATPVLGGMVSSLLHVLVVTPVIFFWIAGAPAWPRIRADRSSRCGAVAFRPACGRSRRRGSRRGRGRRRVAGMAARSRPAGGTGARVIQTVHAKDLDIALLSETGALRQGRNRFFVEFRRTGSDGPRGRRHRARPARTWPCPGW